jgi:hypothetical protein
MSPSNGGIGETLERLEAECVLLVGEDEAKQACGVVQSRADLEEGIQGGMQRGLRIPVE